jgi:hypothetical protein
VLVGQSEGGEPPSIAESIELPHIENRESACGGMTREVTASKVISTMWRGAQIYYH